MKMAKSSPEEMEKMLEFFNRLEAIFEGEFEQDEVFGDYEDELQEAVGTHVVEWWEKFLDGSWARFYWGFDTMLRSVADPELSYLDFKPELRQKLDSQPELLAACEAARAWMGERKQGDWPYDQAVNQLIDQLETAINKAQ